MRRKRLKLRDTGPRGDIVAELRCHALGLADDSDGMELREFVFGTIEGMYQQNEEVFDIVAVENSKKGNGHFERLLRELPSLANGRSVRFREMMNDRLSRHLRSRGYAQVGRDMVLRQHSGKDV